MKKQNKILLAVLAVVIVGIVVFTSTNFTLFQGRFAKDLKPLPSYDENKCYDSDGGKNYKEVGTIYGKINRSEFGNKTDFCSTETQLVEYYCDGKYLKNETYICENGCSSGVCKTSNQKSNNVLDTLVVVNSDDYNINKEDIEKVFKLANDLWLEPKTGIKFNIVDVKIVSFTDEKANAYYNYLNDKYFKGSKLNLPEYIVAFDKDGISEVSGGNAGGFQYFWVDDKEFCTEFPPDAKYYGSSVAASVIDYDQKFGICGYDQSKKNIVSAVSGNGECQNQDGLVCVMKNGYQMCPILVDKFFAQDPLYFTANIIVHELLHSYGKNDNFDHFGTSICNEAMGEKMQMLEKVGVMPPFDTLDNEYAVMCPNIWENFKNSQKSCE